MKYLIISLLTALVITACSNKKTAQTAVVETQNVITLTNAQLGNAKIETGTIGQRSVSSALKVNGRIDVPPQNMVSVSVPLGGYLRTTRLLPGMHVGRNQVIAVLEDNQYIQLQQDYLTAKAQYSFLQSEYNRQKELNASKASSDKVFEQARSSYQTQKVLLRSLEEKLKLIHINPATLTESKISRSINIFSPINGFVSKVNVNVGKYVTPGEVLFELVNPDDIHLNLKVFEKDLDKISIGQKVISYTNNHPERKFTGEIILISKDISPDGTAEVHCHFDNYDQSLVPGMYMNAEIALNNRLLNVLPDEAVVRFEGKEYVFQKAGKNTFEMTEVATQESDNGYTEITSAASLNGKILVTKGAYALLMSLKNKEEE